MYIQHNKGQINIAGFLEIEHSGRMELTQCIYKKQSCGDYCVGFGKPENIPNEIRNTATGEVLTLVDEDSFSLCLCVLGEVRFKQFKDLRICNE